VHGVCLTAQPERLEWLVAMRALCLYQSHANSLEKAPDASKEDDDAKGADLINAAKRIDWDSVEGRSGGAR
jgi:hypothetical protein